MADLPPEPVADPLEAVRLADGVAARIERNVLALAGVVRVIAIAGLVAGVIAYVALLPWVLRLPGPAAAVVAVVLLLVATVPGTALLRHRSDLCEAYGDRELLEDQVAELGASATDAYHRLRQVEDARPDGRLGILRWGWGYLRVVRAVWKAGFGDRFRRLADPIEPTRLARSAWFGLWAVATCLATGPIVALSALGLLVTG